MRPYRPGDEDAFTPRADFARDRATNGWDWTAGPPGPTWAICRWTGEVVGLGGAIEHPGETGRWYGWAQLCETPRRDWPQLLWLAQRVLTIMQLQRGMRRIDAHTAEAPGAMRCLQRLGFTFDRIETDAVFDGLYLFKRTA